MVKKTTFGKAVQDSILAPKGNPVNYSFSYLEGDAELSFEVSPPRARSGDRLEVSASVGLGEYSQSKETLEAALREGFPGMDVSYESVSGKDVFLVKGPNLSFWREPEVARIEVGEEGAEITAYGSFFFGALAPVYGANTEKTAELKDGVRRCEKAHYSQVGKNFLSALGAFGKVSGQAFPGKGTYGETSSRNGRKTKEGPRNHACYEFFEVEKYCKSFVPGNGA